MNTPDRFTKGKNYLEQFIVTDEVLEGYEQPDEVKKIRPVTDFSEALLFDAKEHGDLLPWRKTKDFRFRPHEVTIWTGFNGHKKSMVLGFVCLGLISQDRKICIASPEMHPVKTLKRMLKQFAGVAEPISKERDEFIQFAANHLWLYDQSGTLKAQKLLSIIRYCADKLKINHFVIDSLMKCGINEDDLNKQKWFVDELATAAKDTGLHIHLVAHQRKAMTDELKPGSKYGVAGSANITNLADNVINVFESQKEDRTWDNLIYVEKQRNYEGESNPQPKYMFNFCSRSLQFKEDEREVTRGPRQWIEPNWL